MKKANRFLALGLSVAMAAGLLAGCGGAGSTPAGSAADPASGTDAGSKAAC